MALNHTHTHSDPLNKALLVHSGEDLFSRFQSYFVKRGSGTLAERARETAKRVAELGPMTWDERVMHVQVLCAANVLAMGLLVGVVLLQVLPVMPYLHLNER